MGQAKRRGSYEERKQAAKSRPKPKPRLRRRRVVSSAPVFWPLFAELASGPSALRIHY